MFEAIGRLTPEDAIPWLTWSSVVGWAAVGLWALGLASRVRGGRRWAWIGAGALALGFAAEMAHPSRYAVSYRLQLLVKAVGGDEAIRGRRPMQAVAVAVVVVASALLAGWIARRRPASDLARWSAPGAGAGLLGLALETISLHQLDHYFLIYLALYNVGFLMCLIGLARGRGAPARPASTGHATYRVGEVRPEGGPAPPLARAAAVVAFLVAPELVGLLPPPFGTATRATAPSSGPGR